MHEHSPTYRRVSGILIRLHHDEIGYPSCDEEGKEHALSGLDTSHKHFERIERHQRLLTRICRLYFVYESLRGNRKSARLFSDDKERQTS